MAVSEFCKFHQFGYCKFGSECKKLHTMDTCPTFQCQVEDCSLRHPRLCKFFTEFGRCKFGNGCFYFHLSTTNASNSEDEKIRALMKEIETLKKKIKEMEILLFRVQKMEKEIEYLRNNLTIRVDEKDQGFKCDICEYEASSLTVLKRHKTMKHKQQSAIIEENTSPPSPTFAIPAPPTQATPSPTPTLLVKSPVPCARKFAACLNLVSQYSDSDTALCLPCKKKLDTMAKSNPFSPSLCPCCHSTDINGPPFSFCQECLKYLDEDGCMESSFGSWYLDRITKEIVCIQLDY